MPLVDAIAETFGKNCEVVLHDLRYPDRSIVKISNGHVTGRVVGGPSTDLALRILGGKNGKGKINAIVGYHTKTSKGKDLKSTTIFIRDDRDKIIGCLCINIDTTPFQAAKNIIDEMCRIHSCKEKSESNDVQEKFASSVDTLIEESLTQALNKIGKPLSYMNKEDKLKIVLELKERGLFLIKGTAKRISRGLNVSLPTIYKYLEEI